MAVSDATALIALSKMHMLRLLEDVCGTVLIGPVVKLETLDQGRAIAAPGVEQIEQALEAGWLRTVRLTATERRLMRNILRRSRVDDGEAESLALARSRQQVLIVDDKEARGLAASLGVSHLGTAGILLQAYRKQRLSLEGLEEAVRALCRVMWLSPAVVAEILRRAREAKE